MVVVGVTVVLEQTVVMVGVVVADRPAIRMRPMMNVLIKLLGGNLSPSKATPTTLQSDGCTQSALFESHDSNSDATHGERQVMGAEPYREIQKTEPFAQFQESRTVS
jgi:hypothetical protein